MDPSERSPKRVCFLSEDQKTVQEVSERLAAKGVEAVRFADVGMLASQSGAACRTVLVLDTGVLSRSRDVEPLLNRVDGLFGGRPALVCIARTKDIELRLQALRAGAEAFFTSPVAADELAARLLELSGASGCDGYRILVVDDQPVAAIFAARVLESVEMETRIVGDALQVLDALEEFRPDLVLMDLHMPGADGIELTTLIREHDELFGTPVIFLSSELDTGKQMDALRVGGDDFIAKPVRPERLIESVRRGLRWSRSMGRHGAGHDRDWITSLMNRSGFLKRLDASIVRGTAQGPGSGLLMIELEVPGWGADEVEPGRLDDPIERFAGLLRKHLTKSEYAARYSDTRIAVLASRDSERGLGELAQTLATGFSSICTADRIGASIGIGLFHPRADDALTMISRAKKACAAARRAGGDGIGTYAPLVAAGSDSERDAQLIAMVNEALRSEGFHLMFQPIMALRPAPGERYETTLRLKAPDGEYIPAFDFIPAAQRRGLVPAIDRWVMEHALDELKQQRHAHRRLTFFVHQTMETLSAEDWLSWFRDQIVERDLIKQRPVLQFQHRDLNANRELATDRFHQLHRLGIKTCLDHFENDPREWALIEELGISLARLPLQAVESMEAVHLTRLATRMHEIGSAVIVAQIEQPQTIARVWSCGIDYIQGNFLQLPSEELSFDFSESALT